MILSLLFNLFVNINMQSYASAWNVIEIITPPNCLQHFSIAQCFTVVLQLICHAISIAFLTAQMV